MLDETLLHDRLAKIRLLILDVDGVLTDGGIIMSDTDELKTFNAQDGVGIKYLIRSGIDVAFVTGRTSKAVEHRAHDLGVTELHMKVLKKWPVVEEILKRRGLSRDEVAYVGDDLVDLPVMLRVGLGIAVADATFETRHHAHAVAGRAGGKGAVREVAEAILRAHGKWDQIVEGYLHLEDAPSGHGA